MSEDQNNAPASSPEFTEAAAPRVRRISTPRVKKTASKAAAKKDAEPAADAAPATPAPASAPQATEDAPKASKPAPASVPTIVAEEGAGSDSRQDWADEEPVTEGGGKGGNDKRKRRRRKGKGGQNSQQGNGPVEEVVSLSETPASTGGNEAPPAQVNAPVQAPRPQHHNQHQQHQQRQPVNQEMLAKRAWKIFLAEVSEEGVSLINDQDARELSKRCFRLAEIFLDEQGRRMR
jgi:hypothetical protein